MTYANCAVDALAVPCMADGRVDIESECVECGKAITIQMIGEHVLASQPEAPVLLHVARGPTEAGPAVFTRCPLINFFCGVEHAERWRAAHSEVDGAILTLPQGIARAREIFDRVISSVGGAR